MIFSQPWQFSNSQNVLRTFTQQPLGLGWVNGVDWLLLEGVFGDQRIEREQMGPSWLPNDWPGAARFLGWNRWGQPVVEHETQRFVRRGPRQWTPISSKHPLHADALWLFSDEDFLSTFEGWRLLNLFAHESDCQSYLAALGTPMPEHLSFSQPLDITSLEEDADQSLYQSLSLRSHAAFVPTGLAKETTHALEQWKTRHPEGMDAYVSRETGLDLTVLSGEQVDVVGLILDEIKSKKDFLLGDQTGLGKGRVLAAIAKWAQAQNLIPIFFTERASLFHDFWRDFEDISGDTNPFAQAFILHQNAKLTWPDGQPWKSPFTQKERQEAIATKNLPSSCNLILTTYSQYNRKDEKKIDFLKKLGARAVFIFDEAHNATGHSNIRESVKTFLKTSKEGAVFASATFGKDADHVSFYSDLLGQSPLLHDWNYWLARPDAEPLRIAVSKKLVREGRMVRREQDLSGLKYLVRELPEDQQKDVEKQSDAFAKFGAGLLALQKYLQRFPFAPGSKVDPARLFGGRLYRLNRLALMIMSLDFLKKTALELIADGKKPVIVCETTLEQTLTDEEDGEIKQSWKSLADVLKFEVDDLMSKWAIPSKGVDCETLKEKHQYFTAWIDAHFSELPPSPLDAIIQTLTENGIKVGEVSGRQQQFQFDGNAWVPTPNTHDRVGDVRLFNSGDLDALIVTRAGCSGISLHASKKFKDKRPRELVEWQIPRNVAERVQFFGRVYRKDQVVPSGVSTLVLNLPSERRGQLNQFKKMERLYHFTKGQGIEALRPEQSDYLTHKDANFWALEWLLSYPQHASALGISAEANQRQVAWMDRIFSRLSLLPVLQQQQILNFWDESAPYLFPHSFQTHQKTPLFQVGISPHLKCVGHLISNISTEHTESPVPPEWRAQMISFGDYLKNSKPFFDILSELTTGQVIRWRDEQLKRPVVGKVMGVWMPPAPFGGFWGGYCVMVWSPILEKTTPVSLLKLLNDPSLLIQSKNFPMDASQIAHQEHHRSQWALQGDTERLLIWKTHHRIGEWDEQKTDLLWLPPSYTPERIRTLTLPISHPQRVLAFSKRFINQDVLVAYDTQGGQIKWSLFENGTYSLTWHSDAQLDDGPLVNIIFRQNYGSPRLMPDGRMAMTVDLKTGRSLLFHLLGRGVIFGCSPEHRGFLETLESQ